MQAARFAAMRDLIYMTMTMAELCTLHVRLALAHRFASNVNSLLDFACGRGGDLQKWFDAGVRRTAIKLLVLSLVKTQQWVSYSEV